MRYGRGEQIERTDLVRQGRDGRAAAEADFPRILHVQLERTGEGERQEMCPRRIIKIGHGTWNSK